MSKKAKVWLTVLAVSVVLIGGSALALKLYFTSERLKALVLPKVEEATQRKVTIGDISLSLFPTLAIGIERLTISAPENVEFDKEEFLTLDQLMLDVNILALLKNRLAINNIILRHPKLYLEVNSDGIANYSQPNVPEQPSKPAKGGHEPEPSPSGKEETPRPSTGFLLSNFRIIDGEVEYIDKPADRRIVVANYDQTMRMDVSSGAGNVLLESESSVGSLSYGSMKSFLISNLPMTTYQKLTYTPTKGLLTLDSVSIGIHEILLVLKGTIENVQSKPILNLSLKSTRADVAQLLSLVPKEYMKMTQGISSSGKFQFAMTIAGESSDSVQPAVKGTFAIADGSIRYAGFPKSITNISLSGAFEKPAAVLGKKLPGRFNVEKFSATLGTSAITGKLSVIDFENPSLSALVIGEMNLGEVKEYYPFEQGTEFTGSLKANFSLAGRAKVPTSIKADGKLEFRNVTVKAAASSRSLRNLNGVVTFNNQLIDSKQLSMRIGESDMTLAFTMQNYLALVMGDAAASGKPSMVATLTSKQLRTMDLISEETAEKTATTSPSTSKLSGGDARQLAGEQDRSKPARQTQSALLPNMYVDANVSIDKLVTEKFEFANARGSVKIREGVITLQNFSVNAFEGNLVTKGLLDMRRMDRRPFTLDFDITGVQANALLPKFTPFGNNLFGKFSMKTTLTGDVNDTLGLNTQTLNGEGKVQIFDGKLVGYPMTMKLADYTGISELREIQFKNWSNAFTISDEKIHIKDLKIAAANTDFVVNGSQGFDGSLDYKMLVRLPESVSNRLKIGGLGGELINFLKDKEGRINLTFNVTGTASNPSYALDTREAEQAAKQALEQKVREEAKRLEEEAKKKVEEELKKKAEEGLKKLFRTP